MSAAARRSGAGGVDSRRYALAAGLFAVAAIAQYAGAALAVGAFGDIPAAAVAWWRIAFAALVLALWRRPWRFIGAPERRGLGRTGPLASWGAGAALFGVVLALMNIAFYLAIDHIPLGTAVSLEFAGPVAVAAVAGRRLPQRIAAACAAAGVLTIGGLSGLGGAGALFGMGAALVAGALWAAYVVIGARLAPKAQGIDILAVGMLAGAFATLPAAFFTPASALPTWGATLLAVALLSSVIPYLVDQFNFGALPAPTFAILLATLPATSVLVGAVALGQFPSGAELAGLALVSVAVWLANLRRH